MQDRYAGDVGDYVKLALLRTMAHSQHVGIAWYLHPDEGHNADGRHISYLSSPERWRHLDPELFDALTGIVAGKRSVAALEQCFDSSTIFASEPITTGNLPARDRCSARSAWFERTLNVLRASDFVFADPDNGLVTDEEDRRKGRNFGKQLPLSEAIALSAGRTAVIYHHNSRFKGGHDAEVNHWLRLIDCPAIAVRAAAYSCRTFFIINPDKMIVERARDFCERWKHHKVRLHRSDS